MQTTATIILAILATIFVGGVVWLSKRRHDAAQARRAATAQAWDETAAEPSGCIAAGAQRSRPAGQAAGENGVVPLSSGGRGEER